MKVIVLEDDQVQQEILRNVLSEAGIAADIVGTGQEYDVAMKLADYDVVVLDWTLPDVTGIDLLRQFRESDVQTPVLFLTVRDTEEDVVEALEAGADDFVVKPFLEKELVARLDALIRRTDPSKADERYFKYGEFTFDVRTQLLTRFDTQIELTQKEFSLALLLFRNIGRQLPRGFILRHVWANDSDIPSRTMDTHVSRVRTKLALRPEKGYLLAPIYSYGYRLEHLEARKTIA